MCRHHKLDFSHAHVLVVGDVMLDQYLWGEVARISPEAPVPILVAQKEENTLGGAANVALNLACLGVQTQLVGYVGQDKAASQMHELCHRQKIEANLISKAGPTILKQRIMSGQQQMLRIDHELVQSASSSELQLLQETVQSKLQWMDLIILSDYGKGLCSPEFCTWLIQQCRAIGKPLLVDPKGTNWKKYSGATMVTPNFKEFCDVIHQNLCNEDASIVEYGPQLLQNYQLQALLVTRSEKGMSLCSTEQTVHVHTEAREVFDVSGAGDTVIATLGASMAAGWELEEAMRLANSAAGVVVGKRGTAPIEIGELRHISCNYSDLKIIPRELLLELRNKLNQKAQRIVFTNGCFDILHRGHLQYLRQSRELGDLLIVGLNSDTSVRRLKGPERPVNAQEDRALMLASLEFVDHVVIFEEETPYELLKELRPNILVKGGDYQADQVIGREFVQELVLMDFVDGYSTTRILQKINQGDKSN